ncbi:SpoIIE family protein phosphatase [Streptomyces ferrugineus]|uniref:SpoIIE family protein phosphatase n=1 Tax=Streptomyces ferrugineus TaxID=1413221 RepID=A0A7M2SDF1_9ACTN|nr:SpoIIE family protein phosphatase [Streptomyces ferrugineus]QOV33201.1 SpoIIE family protein phosphatase [Streptomyces ferrugineus]
MTVPSERDEASVSADEIVVILLDHAGTVQGWSQAAAQLLGHAAGEVCGQPMAKLLADPSQGSRVDAWGDSMLASSEHVVFRHRSGRPVALTVDAVRLDGSSEIVLVAGPGRDGGERGQGWSFLCALLAQSHFGVALYDTELKVVRTNATAGMHGRALLQEIADHLRPVLVTGMPLVAGELRMGSSDASGRKRHLSLSAFRLEDECERPTGVAAVYTDRTEEQRARRRMEISHEASARLGDSLDVTRTAQDLVDVLVPALGDVGWVELAEAVLDGNEPPKIFGGGQLHLRRAAVASAAGSWPHALLQPGAAVPPFPDLPLMRTLQQGKVFRLSDREKVGRLGDPALVPLFVPEHGHSVIAGPLFARGFLLGSVALWRTERPEPFEQEDADLLAEIVSRAALCVDNARRFTREHRAAVALQQRLLPRPTVSNTAAESAGSYAPAGGAADISGDWFDVIPLPSLRVAFVVGDVIGHGLHAAATMGRLRAAMRTLADLELEPGELLMRMDDLVQQLAEEADPQDQDTVGGTCLYALYDPVTGSCSLASAGHLPPVVIEPAGTGRLIDVSPGPPLGVGGMPFDTTTVTLEPGSLLALYTDGLVERRDRDAVQGARELLDTLSTLCRDARALQDIGHAIMAGAAEPASRDDMALLLARIHRLPVSHAAEWQFPDDPAVVSDARRDIARQLSAWGLDEIAFTTELIVSELVTNAIRYAGGTVGVRLFHDDSTLVCEVTDRSNTQPRLRRARAGDEGGRGLFLVAQLTKRWGSRYHQNGKTIWAEQPIRAVQKLGVDLAAVWGDTDA